MIKTAKTEMAAYRNVKVANERLYTSVAAKFAGMSPKQVEEFVKEVGIFIHDTIERGAFETVMIPKFGKFRVKVKQVQWMNERQIMKAPEPNGNNNNNGI